MKKTFLFIVALFILGVSSSFAQPYGYKATSCTPSVVSTAYNNFKSKHFEACGSDKIRVKWGHNTTVGKPDETVSEGVAYGMLMSVYAGDQASFDGLWRYYKSFPDPNGLMHWHTKFCGEVLESNAATDAEEDAAIALVLAHYKWGSSGSINYNNDAKWLIGQIKAVEVEGNILKPGDMFGGASVTNISYFAPGYYKVFGEFTNDATFWNGVADKCYEIINNNQNSFSAKGGLVSDWCKADGSKADYKETFYSYDACRTPWRIAVDYHWYGDARAKAYLDKTNGFINSVGGIGSVKDGYNLDGTLITGQRYHNSTFVATFACAGIATNQSTVDSYYTEITNVSPWGYFDYSFDLLSKMLLSGTFTKPNSSVTSYTITASAASNGSISPSGTVNVNQGSSKSFDIYPNSGYTIAEIKLDNVVQTIANPFVVSNVNSNKTLSVSFKTAQTYNIVATAGANGSITPAGTSVVVGGSSKVFTITPAANYKVSDVKVNGSSVGAVTTFTFNNVAANGTIEASFEAGAACTLLDLYGMPRGSALPSVNSGYDFKFIQGTGGPSLSEVTKFTINWDLVQNGLYNFAFNTNVAPWYIDLSKNSQNFSKANPAISIVSSGINGLDGDYWVNMDGENFVMVAKNGNYAIYFSKTATSPKTCIPTDLLNQIETGLDVKVSPSPIAENNEFKVSLGVVSTGVISLFDTQGVELTRICFEDKDVIQVDASLSKGVYILRVSLDGKVITKKIVVK